MLREIRIEGLGVIEDAVLELADGLNVITGETGAGKTMVVQGLNLLLGGRADAALVRGGSGRAAVEGIIELPRGHPALRRAAEAGADEQEAARDGLIMTRTIAAGGRSRAHVGGRAAPVGVLAELAQHLVAVHGQADQWRLQRPEQHRAVLDAYGGGPVQRTLREYRRLHTGWQQANTELATLRAESMQRAQRLDLLLAGLQEIERVDPEPGEEDRLAAEAERLTHAEGLRDGAAGAHRALVGDENLDVANVLELVAEARHGLRGQSEHDTQLATIEARVAELGIVATDIAGELAGYLADLEVDPDRLEAVQQRRADLAALMRRYGATSQQVLQWSKQAAREADELAGSDDRIEELTTLVENLDSELNRSADALSAARRKAAARLGRDVTKELSHLALGAARVVVQVNSDGDFGRYGRDEVQILFASSKAASTRSIAKAASGGELSRVMLALEVVTAGGDVPTFVFDEVDAGVGGAAALDVGARLHALAKHAQVIVVTHLAQVAAYGDRHLVVRKHSDGHVGRSDIRIVEADERRTELARMLGGVSDSQAALSHADELTKLAR